MVWLLSIPVCILYMVFTHSLLGFFINDPSMDALSSGGLYIRILAPFYFVISAKLVADGILRGAAKMKYFMISTFTDLIIRVVLAVILARTSLGYTGIWIAWPIGWSTATFLSIFYYKRKL